MTEPSFVVGVETSVNYSGTQSTLAGPIARSEVASIPPPEREVDPELRWLASAQARRFEGHWVALDPETGELRGLADSDADFRRWQRDGATVVFVEPPGYRT